MYPAVPSSRELPDAAGKRERGAPNRNFEVLVRKKKGMSEAKNGAGMLHGFLATQEPGM